MSIFLPKRATIQSGDRALFCTGLDWKINCYSRLVLCQGKADDFLRMNIN